MIGAVLGTNWKTEELEELSGCQTETAASVPQLLQHCPALNPYGNDDLLHGSLQLVPWVGSARSWHYVWTQLVAEAGLERKWAPRRLRGAGGLQAESKEPCKQLCARPACR